MFKSINFNKQSLVEIINWLENCIFRWIKKNAVFILLDVAFGICIYFKMISENLVNNWDGVWNLSKYYAGGWETSLGRFTLKYFDKMRGGVVSSSLNTILTLILISVASVLILEVLKIDSRLMKILVSGILIANPVVCITLSYCYTSVNYGMAFLFATLAVYCIYFCHKWGGIVLGAFCIGISMGSYQAYLGVVCILLLMILVRMLLQNTDKKDVIRYMLKSIISVLAGGGIYLTLANFFLWREGTMLSSYNGASEVSIVGILKSLPDSIVHCYKDFYDYFISNEMYLISSKKTDIVIICICLFTLFCLIVRFWLTFRRNRIFAFGLLGSICIVPLMCGAIAVIAFKAHIGLLMSMSFVVCAVLLPTVLLSQDIEKSCTAKWGYGILMCLFLWVNIVTISNDQVALSEGKNTTKELSEQIVASLITGGYLDGENVVAMIGRPSENPLFRKSNAYQTANQYAKFGAWWTDGGNSSSSWRGVLKGICGIQLNYCSNEQYYILIQMDEINKLPVFPNPGSILEIDGVIVVKISETY